MSQTMPLYRALSMRCGAYLNVKKRCSTFHAGSDEQEMATAREWLQAHEDTINALCDKHLPHGSGLDSRIYFNFEQSTPERLVISGADFHHMNEHGFYIRWTEHAVIVTASLQFGCNVHVTGRNYRDIKEYIGELFAAALHEMVDNDILGSRAKSEEVNNEV